MTRFNTEIARREMLIGPVLQEFIAREALQVRFEYPLNVSSQLRGSLDYLAVSLGTLWQFCLLHRTEKRLVQELTTYRVPEDLRDVLQILAAVLVGTEEDAHAQASHDRDAAANDASS